LPHHHHNHLLLLLLFADPLLHLLGCLLLLSLLEMLLGSSGLIQN
jgi:hypothetical protein